MNNIQDPPFLLCCVLRCAKCDVSRLPSYFLTPSLDEFYSFHSISFLALTLPTTLPNTFPNPYSLFPFPFRAARWSTRRDPSLKLCNPCGTSNGQPSFFGWPTYPTFSSDGWYSGTRQRSLEGITGGGWVGSVYAN